jgi:tetratricopeptide (TPR) repeat protein
MPVPLHLIHIPELDRLVALEYGRVDDGQPPGCWRPVGSQMGYLHDGPVGRELGFKVLELNRLDVEDRDVVEIWGPPRFDVPILGLSEASAAEIILAARAFFEGRASVGEELFARAVKASGHDALELWTRCLEAGDINAHYGLGCTLYGLGRYRDAYRHLRYYTELAPYDSWTWCWYGRAAEALDLRGEARDAYRRAMEVEEIDGQCTDARELLVELDARHPPRSPRRRGRRGP